MSRNRLVEYLAKANDAFDNMLIKLSVGALGLSFAFYRLVVVDSEPMAVGFLGAAWGLWILSLTCCLTSHYTSGKAMEEAIRRSDKGETAEGGRYDRATRGLNLGGLVAFVVGAAFAANFVTRNL